MKSHEAALLRKSGNIPAKSSSKTIRYPLFISNILHLFLKSDRICAIGFRMTFKQGDFRYYFTRHTRRKTRLGRQLANQKQAAKKHPESGKNKEKKAGKVGRRIVELLQDEKAGCVKRRMLFLFHKQKANWFAWILCDTIRNGDFSQQ